MGIKIHIHHLFGKEISAWYDIDNFYKVVRGYEIPLISNQIKNKSDIYKQNFIDKYNNIDTYIRNNFCFGFLDKKQIEILEISFDIFLSHSRRCFEKQIMGFEIRQDYVNNIIVTRYFDTKDVLHFNK